MRLKKKEKLTAYWDKKENCIGAYHPLGFMTQTDAHYLFDKVFTKEFVKEMTDRGYDMRTMKFEISPKLPNYERFNGLSEKYYGKKKQIMKKNMFEDIVAEGNIVVIDNYWIVLCKCWRPEYHNLFCYLYLHKENKELMVGSHFTMNENSKKSTRLATNDERLMLFEQMFEYGIALNKQEHHLIGKLW